LELTEKQSEDLNLELEATWKALSLALDEKWPNDLNAILIMLSCQKNKPDKKKEKENMWRKKWRSGEVTSKQKLYKKK
jgi:hypothetical protein